MTTIKKGTVLTVQDSRKGTYTGIALEDFDTELDEFYPVAVHQPEPVRGMANEWGEGDSIPCRRGLSMVKEADE